MNSDDSMGAEGVPAVGETAFTAEEGDGEELLLLLQAVREKATAVAMSKRKILFMVDLTFRNGGIRISSSSSSPRMTIFLNLQDSSCLPTG